MCRTTPGNQPRLEPKRASTFWPTSSAGTEAWEVDVGLGACSGSCRAGSSSASLIGLMNVSSARRNQLPKTRTAPPRECVTSPRQPTAPLRENACVG
eukprot:scaffold24734_cov61-Phaeocystis_antarctica.AAC.1